MKLKFAILIGILALPVVGRAVDPAVTADSSNNWLPALRNGSAPNLPANTRLNGGTIATGANISDAVFSSSWNGVTTIAPSKNAIYDYVHQFDTDDNGKVNVLDLAAGIPKTNSSGVLSLAIAGTDYVAPSGILAFAGFSSITGTVPIANVPTGTTGSTVPFGNDSRFTDTRTPTDNTVSTAKLQNDAVTYAKLQNVSATSRILGRKTAGAGDAEELTLSDMLDFVSNAAQGDILYRNATGWVRLAAGTSGQFLKTLGTGANPLWATSAGVVDGQQIFDGSHVLAADFGVRQLFANDGSTTALDWSDPTQVIFMGGLVSIQSDGSFNFVNAKSTTTATKLIDQTGANAKFQSDDTDTYFDNSGFHGIGSVIAGTKTATGTATTTFTVTIGVTMANATYKVATTGDNALSSAVHYVNNKTTTTFDVVYLAGLTGSVSFDWIVTP